MNSHKSSPLRDRLLSNSPDPIKSSILRESGMGWNSPPSSESTSSGGSLTTPLRIPKRDKTVRPPLPDVHRRSSSSYRHLRNNNLVSKSPFKSQIPMPSSNTPSRSTPPLPVSPRRVSGEKRARPLSMHEQAENENERPFALKRERKQSKTYQGLIQKEPVTKSPFRQDRSSSSDPPLPPIPTSTSPLPDSDLPADMETESTSQLQPYAVHSPTKISTPVSRGATPTRSSLVSKRLHGPRLTGKRERRKTVTWDECCDVVEISCGEEGSDNALDVASSDDEPYHEEDHGDPFFQGGREENNSGDESYDSIDVSDAHHPVLDLDTSISGLVDEMFGSRQSTPPRHPNDVPTDLETEDGVPFGRSHHAERFAQHKQDAISPHGIPFDPSTPARASSSSPPYFSRRPTPQDASFSNFEEEDDDDNEDVQMLPESPSPVKRRVSPSTTGSPMPKFGLSSGSPSRSTAEDPFASSSLNDLSLPHEKSMDYSFANSEIDISGLEEELQNHEAHAESKQPEVSSVPAAISNSARNSPRPLPTVMPSLLSRASSPSTHTNGSPASIANRVRPRISREEIQRRLIRQRSFGSPVGSPSASFSKSSVGPIDISVEPPTQLEAEEEEEKDRDSTSILTTITDDVSAMSAEMATIQTAEKRTIDTAMAIVETLEEPALEEFGTLKVDSAHRLKFDFGSKFGRGLDFGRDDDDEDLSLDGPAIASAVQTSTASPAQRFSELAADTGSVDVQMDMRSALDRLMDDMSGKRIEPEDITMSTEDGDDSLDRLQDSPAVDSPVPRIMERAATDSAIVINAAPVGLLSRSASGASSVSIPPPPPPKDNIRSREALIIEKRREMRRHEEEADAAFRRELKTPRNEQLAVSSARPSRRRSMSTGDVDTIKAQEGHKNGGLLDIGSLSPQDDDPLGDSIEKELRKLEGPHKSKYLVRQHEETIYASSDSRVTHRSGAGDLNAGKAWKTVRRPSDMNEYSKQIKEYRAQAQPGKAYGKVFVKVIGLRGISAPLPNEPTAVTCTLNNGIHFVTTPECKLARECPINQEFELIEHSKLEFTLTLKIRRDPHIITQFKALAPPPAMAAPAPPPVAHTSSKGGMRGFFSSSSPKKSKEKLKPIAPPPQPQVHHRLPENLARYLKPDGTLARAFICFKDIAARCDTRIFETAFPLIGQKVEAGNKTSPVQVGEMVLQIFRLPPLPGIAPEQLPQSLEECHRGLRHINWHKVTYFEGTLTQSGGDCISWRRRQLRVIGSNLVAFNDVTKRATATISLKKAIAVEDDQAIRSPALGAAPVATSKSRYADEYDGMFGVERSFRLIFPDDEIVFFADTDEEKQKWLQVFQALVGHIPPHPLWAELLWQRQEELAKKAPKKGSL